MLGNGMAANMNRNLLGWFTFILLLPSCSDNSPDISVVCEENSVGNHVIKWETTPTIEGKLKIYASTDPDKIPRKKPVATTDISDQRITIVTSDPSKRFYYKVVFDGKYEEVIGSRNSNIPGIQNFRDIGGYALPKKKETRWGMLYRSGEIGDIPYSAYGKLQNMGIKTVVDLRSTAEVAEGGSPDEHALNIIHIPINIPNTNDVLKELRDGRIRNDSIYRLMLRMNRDLVTNYNAQYRKVFDVLLEEDNYPLVIHCTTGKGRTAIASALVLYALGVTEDIIMSDYRNSNDYFDIPGVSSFAYRLPSNAQEAITTLFSAREGFLNAAKQQIDRNYGSMDAYLHKGIGLTDDEIKQLKNILLH